MLFRSNMLALAYESLASVSVHVAFDTVLFLAQTLVGFLHVVGNTVLREEGLRLLTVVLLGGIQEGCFEVLLVDLIRDLVDIAFIQTEGHERIDNFLDQPLVNSVTISLSLDQAQDSSREFLVLSLNMQKEIGLPLHQSELL